MHAGFIGVRLFVLLLAPKHLYYSLAQTTHVAKGTQILNPIHVNFEPILNDFSNPDERYVAFHNGLPDTAPPAAYRGGCLKLDRLLDNDLELELFYLSTGVRLKASVGMPISFGPVDAFWVASSRGYFLVLHGHVYSYVEGSFFIPRDTFLATDVATLFGGVFTWLPTVHGWAEKLASLAQRHGVPERNLLQWLLDSGQIKPRR